MKRYISNTQACFNVILKSKKSFRVSFNPLSGTTKSIFYTNDKEVQDAMERHPLFGKLFKIDNNYVDVKKETVSEEDVKKTIKEINVSCIDDAKDYLCDNFGLSRTKLKSEKAILDAAEANNIKFIGLN